MTDRDREQFQPIFDVLKQYLGVEQLSEATEELCRQAVRMYHRGGGQGMLPPVALLCVAILSGEYYEPSPERNEWENAPKGLEVFVHDTFGMWPATFQEYLRGKYEGQVTVWPDNDPDRAQRVPHQVLTLASERRAPQQPDAEAASDVEQPDAEQTAQIPEQVWLRQNEPELRQHPIEVVHSYSRVASPEDADDTDPEWKPGDKLWVCEPGGEVKDATLVRVPGGKDEGMLYVKYPDDDKAYRKVAAEDVRRVPSRNVT